MCVVLGRIDLVPGVSVIAQRAMAPRPGTVQTSVPVNGFICFTVPSGMRIR